MDFAFSPLQQELYDRAVAFGGRSAMRAADTGALSRDAWRQLGEFGALGLSVPEAHGGMGLDALTTSIVLEGLARGGVDIGLLFAAAAHLFAAVMPIAAHGSDELQRRWLPALCRGELVAANAATEAGAGSDIFALRTQAYRDGDDYVVSGEKLYVSNGPDADVIVVYAATAPEHGYLGITAFAVERRSPGVQVGAPFAKLGLDRCALASVYFDRCRVPAGHRLAAEGQGGAVFSASMSWERLCLFAIYIGMMDAQLARCVDHARTRRQFRRALSANQAISHRIADMKLRLEAARLLLYHACWAFDRGDDATLQIALSKLAVSEAAVRSGLDAIQIHGAAGTLDEIGIERTLRDAIPSTIFSGTSEIQRNIISSKLGL